MMKLTTRGEGIFAAGAIVVIIVVSFFSTLVAVLVGICALAFFAVYEFSKPGNKPHVFTINEERRQEAIRSREKIMELFSERDVVTNNDVERLLNISDATATRYLQELENDELVHQVGEGRGTHYKKK